MSHARPQDRDESTDELQLPDLLLAAAFGRPLDSLLGGASTEVRAGLELADFRILARIGSGSMGTVYAAEQKSLGRRVALKLLSPTGASAALLRRFRQEAHLLAGLQHPGIAQVHEAGTFELPELPVPLHYLALELVEGSTLDAWVRERGLDVRARLELVARVCDAVQHAHRRGVIHRDLKPGNVLVVADERGGPGQPKVLDFGVARTLPLGVRTADSARLTQAGQVLGTLAYMSPEQAAGDSLAVDTRSDVYALGVILYRLLCDRPPIDVAGLGLVEAAQRIREVAPVRPSKLVSGIDGEIDTIVLKALAKERGERYGSADELAADLRRHLRGEPILAREHSPLYVLRKAVARNRLLAAVASGLVVVLVVAAVVSGLQARRNRVLAAAEREANERLALELQRSNLERGRLFAMAGNLGAAEDLLWSELERAPQAQEVLWALRELYRRFPCLWTVPVSDRLLWSLVPLPDGRLVSLGYDGRLREHFLGTQRPPRTADWSGAAGPQRLLATRDGRRLVRFSGSGSLDVFRAADLSWMHSRALRAGGHDGFEGNALALDPQDRAWVGLADGRVWCVDLEPGGSAREVLAGPEGASELCVSPDGRLLALGGMQGAVWLVEIDSGRELWRRAGEGDSVGRLVFAPDGARLLAGGRDRKLHVFELETGAALSTWEARNGSIRQIECRPDAARALVGGWWSLDEWELDGSQRRVLLPFPTDCFLALPEHGLLLSSGLGLLRAWDDSVIAGRAPFARAHERTAAVFVGDGSALALGDGAGRVRVCDVPSGRVRFELGLHRRRVRALSASFDGRRLFTGTEDGDVAVVDLDSGEVVERFGPAAAMTVGALALHPDGQRLAYSSTSECIVVRDLRTGAECARIDGLGGVNGLAWLPDGERLVVVERPSSLRLFSSEGRPLVAVQTPDDLWTVVPSPDGRRIAAGAWGGDVHLFDAGDLSHQGRLEGHFTTVWDLSFAGADVDRLYSAAGDGSVRLWDLASRRCLMVLDELQGWEALSVDVARDGRLVAIAGSNGQVVILDPLESDRCIRGNLEHRLGGAGVRVLGSLAD